MKKFIRIKTAYHTVINLDQVVSIDKYIANATPEKFASLVMNASDSGGVLVYPLSEEAYNDLLRKIEMAQASNLNWDYP